MITRITGTLEAIEALDATVRPEGMGLSYQVLVPPYHAERLRERVGQRITLHTLEYFEVQGPGGAMIPRLIGFASPQERKFFDLMTSIDGLGNRKALRAMAEEPAQIARAIAGSDATWLQRLPGLGRKTAEKVILELKGKVDSYLSAEELAGLDAGAMGGPRLAGPAGEAVGALVALGEARPDAERMVRQAMAGDPSLMAPDQIVAAAYATARR